MVSKIHILSLKRFYLFRFFLFCFLFFGFFCFCFIEKLLISISYLRSQETPCDNQNLMSNSLKKTLLQLFLYFSVQIQTKNYKLIYELQFRHFIKWGKIFIAFGTLYDQPWAWTLKCHKNVQLFLTSTC